MIRINQGTEIDMKSKVGIIQKNKVKRYGLLSNPVSPVLMHPHLNSRLAELTTGF